MSLFNELKRRNVVRVGVAYGIVAWLLIQLAGALEPALLLPDWVDRVVTVFLLIGFPIVLIFAWAFELTPEGIKLTRDVDPNESITPKTGKKLEHTTIVLLALLVLFSQPRHSWIRMPTLQALQFKKDYLVIFAVVLVIPRWCRQFR